MYYQVTEPSIIQQDHGARCLWEKQFFRKKWKRVFLHWYSWGFIVHRGCFFSPFYRGPANPDSGLLVNSILVFVSFFPVVFDTVTCHRHQWYFSSATFHLGFLIMNQFVVSRFHGYHAEVIPPGPRLLSSYFYFFPSTENEENSSRFLLI